MDIDNSVVQTIWILFSTADLSVKILISGIFLSVLALLSRQIHRWKGIKIYARSRNEDEPITSIFPCKHESDFVENDLTDTTLPVNFELESTQFPIHVVGALFTPILTPSISSSAENFEDIGKPEINPFVAKVPSRSDGAGSRTIGNTRIFDPQYFRRHSKVAGFIYLARNSYHQPGLHKIGYTTLNPNARLKQLNNQHKIASDVGVFLLMHSVPVSDSYEAEQALFDVLSNARVAMKREFFFERQELLIRGLEAARQFSVTQPDAFTQFNEWSQDGNGWSNKRPENIVQMSVIPLIHPECGWVYIVRNPWHRDNIYRVSCTRHSPLKKVESLNAVQRQLTSQIGFYGLVYCVGISDVVTFQNCLNRHLSQYRIKGSRVFYDASLDTLKNTIREKVQKPTAPQVAVALQKISPAQILVEEVNVRPSKEWVAWTSPCPGCGVILRLRGIIGVQESRACPVCAHGINCYIGSMGAIISDIALVNQLDSDPN